MKKYLVCCEFKARGTDHWTPMVLPFATLEEAERYYQHYQNLLASAAPYQEFNFCKLVIAEIIKSKEES